MIVTDLKNLDQVRVVGDDMEPKVCSINEAEELANEEGLDLVEVSGKATPPVFRLIDYNKYLFQEKKKKKQMKSAATKPTKEIRFSPTIETHDLNHKMKHAKEFIDKGQQVKITITLKGRQRYNTGGAFDLMGRVAKELKEIASVQQEQKMEGNRISMSFAPLSKKGQ
jgi:translation initiation factor IF-3